MLRILAIGNDIILKFKTLKTTLILNVQRCPVRNLLKLHKKLSLERGDLTLKLKKEKNLTPEQKRTSRIATYATIMLLMVILVIIIAAIADNREQSIEAAYKSQLDQSTQMNLTIQDQITSLSNENYELKEKVKTADEKNAELSKTDELCRQLSEISKLIKDNKIDEAKEKYSKIDSSAVPESVSEFYLMITEALTEK